jgi:hypothetical protein
MITLSLKLFILYLLVHQVNDIIQTSGLLIKIIENFREGRSFIFLNIKLRFKENNKCYIDDFILKEILRYNPDKLLFIIIIIIVVEDKRFCSGFNNFFYK